MNESWAALAALVKSRRVAALGTLHEGAPYVSMVPFALLDDGSFLVHVSDLSAHTQDMRTDPRVSLLLVEPESAETLSQALARATIVGRAAPIEEPSAAYDSGKERYLERFPDAEPMFGFADFSLFAIRAEAVRWIGGFAAAESLSGEEFAGIVAGDAG